MQPPPQQPEVAAPDDLAEQIGKEIDRARNTRGMSVSELHRKTGISRTVLQGYEAGRFKPGARELYLIARALNISPNRLLFGQEDFRTPDPLAALLGAPDKASNMAKLSIVFGILSREEQRAVLGLVSLMVEARIGGREKLAEALQAVEAVIGIAPEMFQNIESVLTPELQQKMAVRVQQALPPIGATDPPAKQRRKSTKPG